MSSLGVGGVLSRSFAIWLKNFPAFAVISLFMLSPYLLYTLAVMGGEPDADSLQNLSWVSNLSFLFEQLAAGTVAYGVFEHLRGARAGVSECISVGLRRALPVILVAAVVGVCIGLGLVALLIPGLVLWCAFSVAAPAAVVEMPGVQGAMARSWQLTKGHRLHIFGVLFLLWLVEAAVGYLVLVTLVPDEGATLDDLRSYVYLILPFEVAWVALNGVARAVIYHDLRVIKEGVATEELARVFE